MATLTSSIIDLLDSPSLKNLEAALGVDASLYLVGGTVRDALLGLNAVDLDCSTALPPQEVVTRLQGKYRVIPTGIDHGTVRILLPDSQLHSLELTTFRLPSGRNDARYSTTIEEDLSGRDFTINAMAVSLKGRTLIDPFLGAQALHDKQLIAVGNAEERFKEDPLRILRAVRFGPAQGRVADGSVVTPIKNLSSLLEKVSIERIRDELERIFLSAFPAAGLSALRDWGLLSLVLPEFLETVGFEQNEFHHEDVFDHTCTVLGRSPPTKLLRFSALFHDIGKPKSLTVSNDGKRHFYLHETIGATMAEEALTRLRFGSDDIKKIKLLVQHHMRPIDCGPSGVRRLFRDLAEHFNDWRSLKIADCPPSEDQATFSERLAAFDALVAAELEKLSLPVYGKLAVNGDDIIGLGLTAGPRVGEILKELEEIVIEDPTLNEKATLMKRAKELI